MVEGVKIVNSSRQAALMELQPSSGGKAAVPDVLLTGGQGVQSRYFGGGTHCLADQLAPAVPKACQPRALAGPHAKWKPGRNTGLAPAPKIQNRSSNYSVRQPEIVSA